MEYVSWVQQQILQTPFCWEFGCACGVFIPDKIGSAIYSTKVETTELKHAVF